MANTVETTCSAPMTLENARLMGKRLVAEGYVVAIRKVRYLADTYRVTGKRVVKEAH